MTPPARPLEALIAEADRLLAGITPGEWLIDGRLVYVLHDYPDSRGRSRLVNRFTANVAAWVNQGGSEREADANTALIAASPRLVRELVETIRLLRGAMAAQEDRERQAGTLCGVLYEAHGCDWPDAVAERVQVLQARLRALEAITPPPAGAGPVGP